MDDARDLTAADKSNASKPSVVSGVLGLLGIVVFALALWETWGLQFNVVTYQVIRGAESVAWWFSRAFAGVIFLSLLAPGVWRDATNPSARWTLIARTYWPLWLAAPLAGYSVLGRVPFFAARFGETPPFALTFLLIVGVGWAALRAAARCCSGHTSCDETLAASVTLSTSPPLPSRGSHYFALGSIFALIAVLVSVHTQIQNNLFEHFMLGHADIGHYTEELKNALVGRGLRCDSFDNTRLGWHFVPLMYLLVPGYALWPTPVYLMVCGALAVHFVALPVYFFARHRSRSVGVAWMWAIAWLMLPQVSRMIYGNTYGFQWNNVTMIVLALVMVAGLMGRWRTCVVMVGILLLCRETAAAAVVGWGLYVAMATPRRKLGIAMAVVAVAYYLLCVHSFIPYFAASHRYERFDLFGELGDSLVALIASMFSSPGLFFGRLARPEVFYLLLMLITPMGLLPLVGWRLTLAAFPTLALVLLMANADYLSIKFWHHASVLTIFFVGAMTAMRSGDARKDRLSCVAAWIIGSRGVHPDATNRGMAFSVLICATMGHYLYGYSPLAKSYEAYHASAFLATPDPRMDVVRQLRDDVPKGRTILATERMAAHFTDYHRLYTGRAERLAHFVIIDRSDRWDTSGLPQEATRFERDEHYRRYGEYGSIIVFERRPGAPPPLDTD